MSKKEAVTPENVAAPSVAAIPAAPPPPVEPAVLKPIRHVRFHEPNVFIGAARSSVTRGAEPRAATFGVAERFVVEAVDWHPLGIQVRWSGRTFVVPMDRINVIETE